MRCCFAALAKRSDRKGDKEEAAYAYNLRDSSDVRDKDDEMPPSAGSSSDIFLSVQGSTVHVPNDYATLKEALSQVPQQNQERHTILIEEGSFDSIVLHVPNVHIKGSGIDRTKLVGALTVVGGTKGCVVSDLSIMCSRGSGVDISGRESRLHLNNCKIADCDGSGVVVGEGSSCAIVGCIVEKNKAHGITGHGTETQVQIRNTQVRFNSAHGVYSEHGCPIELSGDIAIHHNANNGICAKFDESQVSVLSGERLVLHDNRGGDIAEELGGKIKMGSQIL